MDNEKLKKLSLELCCNKENYMKSFRKNVDMYVAQKDITIREISEKAGISFDTLKNFLYKDSSDCKLSTAVKLAKALNVSIDELVGAGTISEITRKNIALCRNLPENDLFLVRWYINYMDALNSKNEPKKRYISIMELECDNTGNLKITTNYRKLDISSVKIDGKCKIFFGINMPCDYYMPAYSPYDILLIANDRPPMRNDHSLIRIGNCLYIAQRKKESGKYNYYSIRDGKFRLTENDIDENIGYIAGTTTGCLSQ